MQKRRGRDLFRRAGRVGSLTKLVQNERAGTNRRDLEESGTAAEDANEGRDDRVGGEDGRDGLSEGIGEDEWHGFLVHGHVVEYAVSVVKVMRSSDGFFLNCHDVSSRDSASGRRNTHSARALASRAPSAQAQL